MKPRVVTRITGLAAIAAVCSVLNCRAALIPPDAFETWSANGHTYAVYLSPGISWDQANLAAGGLNIFGLPGYLATITSPEEDAFILDVIHQLTDPGELYAGGFQEPGVTPPDAGWQWVTGEPWDYTNWATGEPNDAYGTASEQWLGINWQGAYWNDESFLDNIGGYVVEYEPAGVPDPGSTWLLLSLGLGGLAWIRRP